MPIDSNEHMHIYCLNVGQGDTTIIITPDNNVVIIDAVNASKIRALLKDLGLDDGETIKHVIVSHPHYDHYSAVAGLLNNYAVEELTLSSLRRYEENKPGYVGIINQAVQKKIPLNFCSGYRQVFPDETPFVDENALLLELLGPSNQLIDGLFDANRLNTNHYSIMARLNLGRFRMIVAGDAQMENWFHYDRERMLDGNVTVMRSAHHGSANGTQYEALTRVSPRLIIVSSDPGGKDKLPDLIGCAAFRRYRRSQSGSIVSLTKETGSIYIKVRLTGGSEYYFFEDKRRENVDLNARQPLKRGDDPTDWNTLAQERMATSG